MNVGEWAGMGGVGEWHRVRRVGNWSMCNSNWTVDSNWSCVSGVGYSWAGDQWTLVGKFVGVAVAGGHGDGVSNDWC